MLIKTPILELTSKKYKIFIKREDLLQFSWGG